MDSEATSEVSAGEETYDSESEPAFPLRKTSSLRRDEDSDEDGNQIWESMCLHVLDRLESTERSLSIPLQPLSPLRSTGGLLPISPPHVDFCWNLSNKLEGLL